MARTNNVNQLAQLETDYHRKKTLWLAAHNAEGTTPLDAPQYAELKAAEEDAGEHMDKAEDALIKTTARKPAEVLIKLRLLVEWERFIDPDELTGNSTRGKILRALTRDVAALARKKRRSSTQ
jgi:hypothetical protein